jgi:hypothetical protein
MATSSAAAAQAAAIAAAAAKAKAATSYSIPSVIARPTTVAASNFTYGSGNPLYVAPKPAVVTQKAPAKAPTVAAGSGATNTFIPGIPGGDYSPGKTPVVTTDRTVLRTVTNADGTTTIFYSDGSSETVGTPTPTPIKKEITANAAYDTIGKILESYGITGLASVLSSIRDEYPEARSDELLSLLQFDSRYNAKFNERFAGNVARQKAGLSVLSPGDYLKTEESYKKVFTAYGLTKFNNQTYYDKFITSDIASTELTDRIQLAYDRVLGDDPVNTAFKKFYPSLGLGDIVTAMLDPVNQLPDLERKVKAAEIGGAALRQGFTNISQTATTTTVGADVLAQQGLTKAQAELGYKTIAQELPQAEKFSSIYAGQSDRYGMLEAEKDTLQGLASEERKKKALIALEAAQFSSDTGTSKASTNTNYLNRTSGAGQF